MILKNLLLLGSTIFVVALIFSQPLHAQKPKAEFKANPSPSPTISATPSPSASSSNQQIQTYPTHPTPQPVIVQMQPTSKDRIDYLLATIQMVGTVINVLALLGLFYNLKRTREIADATIKSMQISEKNLSEMKAARIQEAAPHVIVYFDMPYSNDFVVFFVVKNIGKTIAENVRFKFDPPLQTGFGEVVHDFDVEMVKNGISSLAPNQEIRTPLDALNRYFEDKLPSTYSVETTYSGGLSEELITTKHILDLTMFRGLSVLQKKGDEDLIEAIEKLASSGQDVKRHLDRISDTLSSGLWIKNHNYKGEPNVEAWKRSTLAELKEFITLWKFLHTGDDNQRGRFYYDNLQSTSSIFSSHIISLASSAPDGISKEITDLLIVIGKKLNNLSRARFYMDGGESERKFTVIGDEAVSSIEEVLDKML